jgi:hypothetical protein
MTPFKKFRTTFVSAIFRKFGSCFVPFDIAGETNISFQLKFITKIEYHIVGLNFTTIFVAIDVSK